MYFSTQSIDRLYEAVPDPMSQTVSLCHHCHKHVPALRYIENNKVYIAKLCEQHGVMHNCIENDADFYQSLKCVYDPSIELGFYNHTILIEVTDRCNLNCPHCYHIPNNLLKDRPLQDVINHCVDLKRQFPDFSRLVFAGAECTIRKDFPQLIEQANKLGLCTNALTNAVRLADRNFTQQCIDAGLDSLTVGLNHPSYIDSQKIRSKQEQALDNASELGLTLGAISYTMNSYDELNDILLEILNTDWNPQLFRIRYGSDIGTNPGQPRLFLSDLYKAVQNWCDQRGLSFKVVNPMDNNIYHCVVNVEGRLIRLIQWCDETDIDMESIKSGPWNDFVGDGVTNFLHQIIRRDISKNLNIVLPDQPPERYKFRYTPCSSPLELRTLE